MHVENLAILDTVFGSESFHTMLPDAEPNRASNLIQIVAIGAICNAASFDNSGSQEKTTNGKSVSGNATGDFVIISASCIIPDGDVGRCGHSPLF